MINFLKKTALGVSSLALASLLSYTITFSLFDIYTGAGSMGNIAIVFPLMLFFFVFFHSNSYL
jgi:hypothetical protein